MKCARPQTGSRPGKWLVANSAFCRVARFAPSRFRCTQLHLVAPSCIKTFSVASFVGFYLSIAFTLSSFALGEPQYVETSSSPGSLLIADGSTSATLFVESNDFAGVVRAASDLQ